MDEKTKEATGRVVAEFGKQHRNFVADQLEGFAGMIREGHVEVVEFSWDGGTHASVHLRWYPEESASTLYCRMPHRTEES